MARTKKKQPVVPAPRGVGQPRKYGREICRVRGFSMPETLIKRLATVAEQTGHSQSAIVVAGLRAILSQSPDRLLDAVAGR